MIASIPLGSGSLVPAIFKDDVPIRIPPLDGFITHFNIFQMQLPDADLE